MEFKTSQYKEELQFNTLIVGVDKNMRYVRLQSVLKEFYVKKVLRNEGNQI